MSNSTEADASEKSVSKMPSQTACRKRHFAVADRIIGIVEDALKDEFEAYRYVETLKDGTATVLDCSTLGALNEVRLGRIVKLLADLFDIQRTALGIPCVKEKNDVSTAAKKLEQELHIADRKLDFELMKLERELALQESHGENDSFFRALGVCMDENDAEGDDCHDEQFDE